MRHNTLLCTFLVALVLGCATAAFASPAPGAATAEETSLQTPPCSPVFDVSSQDSEAALSKLELPGSGPVEPEFLARGFKRYCRCSCSSVPNCNTSADCGGSACLAGITCC